MAKSIAELLSMETAEQDATSNTIDVFGEKSKDADELSEKEMMNLAIDIALGSTPMGAVGSGKGAMSFLKGLFGRAKSKYKFPVGYGEPTKPIGKTGQMKTPRSNYSYIDEMEHIALDHPEKANEIQQILLQRYGNMKNLDKAIDDYYKLIDDAKRAKSKPKGIRQFGKFNRQKWEK